MCDLHGLPFYEALGAPQDEGKLASAKCLQGRDPAKQPLSSGEELPLASTRQIAQTLREERQSAAQA